MSDLEKKVIRLNISNIKPPKIMTRKIAITPKKTNLCKKYFYIDNTKAMNLKQFNNGKILQLIENNNKQEKRDILEQVDYVVTQFEQKKTELNKKKLDCIKSMILNNKNIPEKWIMKPNYKKLLNEAMEDEIVLNYAILCQDKYKKTAGMDQSDDERYLNYIKSLPPEKKFISYINPYSRNYLDSPIKKQIMNNYCLSIKRDNKIFKRNKNININELDSSEKNGKFLQLIEDNNKQEKGGVLQQVDYIMTQFEQKKTELNKKKIDCIKSLILNNKKIPEKWIMKPNYKQILNKAMEDEIVLNYAILCKDKHRKTAGLDQNDDERYLNYIKSLPPEKKFISYINPYSRNYCDPPFKKQIMNKYCLSLRRDNNNYKRIRYINDISFNRYETNKKLYKKLSHDIISMSIGNIPKEKNKLPMINNKSRINIDENNIKKRDISRHNNINETKDDLMVTSLYYNKYNKEKDNNTNNNSKLPELPII